MDAAQLQHGVKTRWQNVKDYLAKVPDWRWKLYAGIDIVLCLYLAWCKWGPQPADPGAVTISVPKAPQIAQMETKIVYVPKLVVIKEKADAVAKLELPATEAHNPKEELLTAAAVAANHYGATAVVFVNASTGQSRTDIVYKKAPWFSFERGNTAGVGVGYSSNDGTAGKVYYKRDVAQIKGVYIQGQLDAIARPDAKDRKAEIIPWANIEYRW